MTDAFIISDAHLGTPHARVGSLLKFLRSLDPEATLILNGDVVDSHPVDFGLEHEAVLTELREQSHRREVIWVRGNHDRRFQLPDPAGIQFVGSRYPIGSLLVTHGADLFALRPHHRVFIAAFRVLYRLRLSWGMDTVHIAEFAKRYRWLYQGFRNRVRRQALALAREGGHRDVCCGHTHCAEVGTATGIRYWNTGCWTEGVAHYVRVTDGGIQLERWVCEER